jgi:D-arabinitol 2-dehydrogenase
MPRQVFSCRVANTLKSLPRYGFLSTPQRLPTIRRPFHATSLSCQTDKKSSCTTQSTITDPHGGSLARTDSRLQVEYRNEGDLPTTVAVQGRGGEHFKRTLASFSLEGGVAIVTGGARGLGLVMSQALVTSGADLAIVDLNSMFSGYRFIRCQKADRTFTEEEATKKAKEIVSAFRKDNPGVNKLALAPKFAIGCH